MTRPSTLHGGFALVVALAVFGPAAAADDIPTFKSRKDMEKKFVSSVCIAILKAAHFSGREPAMEKYEYEEVKKGRTKLTIRGSYKGLTTGKQYQADITIHLDTLDPDKWEVLRVEYSDNNNDPHNRKKLEQLVKKFNRIE
jgi:hypothetical protein